jgi:hypothetical protein
VRPLIDIDADLTAAYAARRRALDVSSQSADGLSVQRQTLDTLNATIALLAGERDAAAAAADPSTGGSFAAIPTVRGW